MRILFITPAAVNRIGLDEGSNGTAMSVLPEGYKQPYIIEWS